MGGICARIELPMDISSNFLSPLPLWERVARRVAACRERGLRSRTKWFQERRSFFNTSLFQNLSARNPSPSSHRVRRRSASLSACWPPSTSKMRRLSKDTKSTMYGPIGACRLIFIPLNRSPRSRYQSPRSASVILREELWPDDVMSFSPPGSTSPSPTLPQGERENHSAAAGVTRA